MRHRLAQLGLLIVAIIWGTGFVMTEIALRYFNPFQMMALRFSIAFIAMLLVYRKRLKFLTKNSLIKGSFLGLVLFLAFAFQTIGLQYTTVSKNAFLTSLNVVFVPIIAFVYLKQRIGWNTIIGVVLSVFGVSLLSMGDGVGGFNVGDSLTLGSAICFAVHIIATERFTQTSEVLDLVLVQMAAASCVALMLCLFMGFEIGRFDSQGVFPILYLALISTLLAYIVQTYSQTRTSSTEAAVILSTESFFGMLGSVVLLGELVNLKMLYGAIMIFGGILVTQITIKKKEPRHDKEEELDN